MAKTIQLKWNCPNLYRCGDLRVVPGLNIVRKEVWDAVKENPGVVQRLKKGQLLLSDSPPPAAPEAAPEKQDEGGAEGGGQPAACILKDYDAKAAVGLVEQMLDLETLKVWEADEDRKPVLKAIAKQIKLVSINKDEGGAEGGGE